jgi:DNA-directed RNA polymerase specialized sigma24 family protein
MSVLFGVVGDDPAQKQRYLQRFCVSYTEPLVQFLSRTKRIAWDEAEELVQEFWLRKMLEPAPENNLVAKYLTVRESDPKTSFRRYLFRSLTNHFLNHYQSGQARRDRRTVHLDSLEGWEPADRIEQQEFDAAWANHLLQRVLTQVYDECHRNGHEQKWRVFIQLVLRPCLANEPRPSYSELANSLGFRNPQSIGNAWMTVRRMFMRHFTDAVRDYVPAKSLEDSVVHSTAEVQSLLLQLSTAGGLSISAEQWGIESHAVSSDCRFELEPITSNDLFRSPQDYQSAWQAVLSEPFSSTLELPASDPLALLTINNLLTGKQLDPAKAVAIQRRAKNLGLGHHTHAEDHVLLPQEIYGLVYLLAIAAAKIHFKQDTSTQTDAQLASKSKMFLAMVWVDDAAKQFLKRFANPV